VELDIWPLGSVFQGSNPGTLKKLDKQTRGGVGLGSWGVGVTANDPPKTQRFRSERKRL
jgi:hypothetical protein